MSAHIIQQKWLGRSYYWRLAFKANNLAVMLVSIPDSIVVEEPVVMVPFRNLPIFIPSILLLIYIYF